VSTATDAREWLVMATSATLDPVLTDAELDLILRGNRRADAGGYPPETRAAWAANQPYDLGTELVPTQPNGHVYRVTSAGVSGAAEPVWPTASGATVTDGTAVHSEAGPAWSGAWHLPAAAVAAWRVKAGKAAERYSLSTDGQSLSRSDLIAHCERMAAHYLRLCGGTLVVGLPGMTGVDGVPNNWNPG